MRSLDGPVRFQGATVQLPRERLLQLKEVSEALGGVTMSWTVGYLVGLVHRQGLVAKHIPGITVERLPDWVAVQIEDGPRYLMTLDAARALALALRDYATGQRRGAFVDLDHDFRVERRGNGVKVAVPFSTGTLKTYSVDLALDLAELLDQTTAASP